jgi:hypothetical protein
VAVALRALQGPPRVAELAAQVEQQAERAVAAQVEPLQAQGAVARAEMQAPAERVEQRRSS